MWEEREAFWLRLEIHKVLYWVSNVAIIAGVIWPLKSLAVADGGVLF